MHLPLLAQLAAGGGPLLRAWQIGMGCALWMLAGYLVFLAVAGRMGARGGERQTRGEQPLLGAVFLAAMGYNWLASAFGWPGAGAGLKIVRQLLVETAVYVSCAALWMVVQRLRSRGARSSGVEPPPAIESLAADEELLWIGRPDPALFRGQAWTAFAFSFLPLTASGVCAAIVVASLVAGRVQPALALPLLAFVGFFAIGAQAFFTPWRVQRRLQSAVYAITQRRALVVGAPGWRASDIMPFLQRQVYSFEGPRLSLRALKRRSSRRVDIVFAQEQQEEGRGGPRYVDVGFIGLRKWQEAEEQLERLFPKMPWEATVAEPLEGTLGRAPLASRAVVGFLAAMIAAPWVTIGVLATAAGARAILDPLAFPELWICLPAGLALLSLTGFLAWYALRFLPRTTIQWFLCDGRELQFRTADDRPQRVEVERIVAVEEQRNRRGIGGWRLVFENGRSVLLSPATPNGPQLAAMLQLRPGLWDGHCTHHASRDETSSRGA